MVRTVVQAKSAGSEQCGQVEGRGAACACHPQLLQTQREHDRCPIGRGHVQDRLQAVVQPAWSWHPRKVKDPQRPTR